MRALPQDAGDKSRINTGLCPPRGFITATVNFAMVTPAQRDGELITDLAAECSKLDKTQMMRVCGATTTNETRLLRHIPDVVAIADAPRLRQRQNGFVYRQSSFSLLNLV